MNQYLNRCGRSSWLRFGLIVAVYLVGSVSSQACSIFVLTDSTRTLYCNNEDYLNSSIETRIFDATRAYCYNNGNLLNYGSKTRIWFVPAGLGYYGCAYVGYGDGVGQGGINTHGLSYDWVAGAHEKWTPNSALKEPNRVPSMQMLETCTTVNEAIAFFKKYRDVSFFGSKILVADGTGASVIIGVEKGELRFDKSTQTRGFGAGGEGLQQMLTKAPEPTVANGFRILRSCSQKDICVTVYSNIFDLKSGDLFLAPFPHRDDEVKLNLEIELAKGSHYYDISQIHEQMTQSLKPLLANMRRDYYDIHASHLSAYLVREILYACWLIRNTALLFALIWIPRKLLGQLKGVRHLSLRIAPLASTLCSDVLNVVFARIAGNYFFAEEHLKELTVWSSGLYLSSLGFVFTAMWGLFLLISVPRTEVTTGVWWHSLLVIMANLIGAGYLIYWVCIAICAWA